MSLKNAAGPCSIPGTQVPRYEVLASVYECEPNDGEGRMEEAALQRSELDCAHNGDASHADHGQENHRLTRSPSVCIDYADIQDLEKTENGKRRSTDLTYENMDTPLHRPRAVTISDPSIWRRRSALKTPMRLPLGGCRLPMSTGPKSPRVTSQPVSPRATAPFNNPIVSKRIQFEEFAPKYALKCKLNKLQRLLDGAFEMITSGDSKRTVEGADMAMQVMSNARLETKFNDRLINGLCDYVRETGYLNTMLNIFLDTTIECTSRISCGTLLVEYLNSSNRHYLCQSGDGLDQFMSSMKHQKEGPLQTLYISILENFFQDGPQTCTQLVDGSALDYLLNVCKTKQEDSTTSNRSISRALANLCLNSDLECQQQIMDKNGANWLFLLASNEDDQTRYYACLAVCALVANKEIEATVIKSETLSLVEPFISSRQPDEFRDKEKGRSSEWLAKLVPLLRAKRSEPRSIAAFHMALEAGIKKDQDTLDVFEKIGAIEALKEVASSPEETAPKFARLALEIIGEQVPYKLSQQVALWTLDDVQRWVKKIGFEAYAPAFQEHQVDGDLLLLITEKELQRDIGMESGLVRRRFVRELENLKISADYSCLDGGTMDRFLASVDRRFSIYTYKFLDLGVDASNLASLTEEVLQKECGITNPVHRKKLVQSFQGCQNMEDVELALLSKQIDVFICYRRCTGSQLASLVKVLLQLQGYKVFIDIDRLYAGKFDCSLLKNIQAAKHFVLVLTPQTLDRCFDDDECVDWVHKEILCAIQHNKNIIPVLDSEFQWPEKHRLPADIQVITRFNGVRWVHEYQEACVAKLEKFIIGEVNMDVLSPHHQQFPRSAFIWPSRPTGSYDAEPWKSRSRSNTNGFKPKSPVLSPTIPGQFPHNLLTHY